MNSSNELVLCNIINPKLAVVTLNDPQHLNAMSQSMAIDFKNTIDKLKTSQPSLRALILTGAGKAFSAGGDLKMLLEKTKYDASKNKQSMLDFYGSFLCMLELKVPIIAAINGAAIGAGLCVASACDIRICSEQAKFGYTFTKLGLHPGMGATYFVPRITNHAVASQLLITGEVIDATEAFRIGLVSKILPTDKLLDHAFNIASQIESTGKECIAQLLVNLRAESKPLKECLDIESDCQALNYNSSEFLEGVTAMIEKRTARF